MLAGLCLHTQAQPVPTVVRGAPATSGETQKLSGNVTDAAGKPVAGATVEYWHAPATASAVSDLELKKQLTTGADGKYEIEAATDIGFVLAGKPGLAPAWRMMIPSLLETRGDQNLVLTPPGALTGTVMDESNQPVAAADVSVAEAFGEKQADGNVRRSNILIGKPAHDMFTALTDAAGRFRIENFPTNASAIFDVKMSGKVLHSEQIIAGPESPGYRVGDTDIKLVLEPAGSIEGKIICSESNQAPPVARLALQWDQPTSFSRSGYEPVRSGADGAFRIPEVADGGYHVRAIFGTNAESEWVAEPVAVSVEAGKVTRDVQITAQRGALLEVTVLGKEDRKPMAQANVTAYRQNSQANGLSDSNGIARLHVLPGDYQIYVMRPSAPAVSSQTTATVEAGKTNRAEIEIAEPKKITGIVRAPDGKPAAGISVQLIGGGGPNGGELKTDADGKFELEWSQRQFVGQSDSTPCVLVRDSEHNLAAAEDLDEDTTNFDLKLAPALTLAGRVEFEGKPVTNATAALVFWPGRSGQWLQGLARTNTPGLYEIPALPPGRKYGVIVSAPGFGQLQNHNLEISADPGRQELDTVELKPANLKVSGQVLAADDNPVAGCYVNLNGNGQPNGNVRTDRQGRFTFDHVCEGMLQLSANSQSSFGNISAEAGDTNVVLRLGQNVSSSPDSKVSKLHGTVTGPDDKPVSGAQVAVFPTSNGRQWFKTGAAGEYSLTWSLQQWQLQNGNSAYLVVRDLARNLAAAEELPDDATNLNVKLKPALTLGGVVKDESGAPVSGAEVGLWFRAGNTLDSLDEQQKPAGADGRFEIKCLPADGRYTVWATAKGYGRIQQQVEDESETNRLDLEPFVLKLANRVIAGVVLTDDDKPASGANVQINGDGQPQGQTTADSKGRFHFQVCEGMVRIIAFPQSGGVAAQESVDAGDTNIVMHLRSQPVGLRQAPSRRSLKGSPLPDLSGVNLAADAAPAGQPVLLCLFDASQRPSRHAMNLLAQKTAALKQNNISLLAVQAAVVGDEVFNDWKTAGTVTFPVGRVTEQSDKSKWATSMPALPWLILADANHRIIAEGFSTDELDAQIEKVVK